MNKEQISARSLIDRQLMTLDQKIERHEAVKTATDATLADLYAAREGMLAAGLVLRSGGG